MRRRIHADLAYRQPPHLSHVETFARHALDHVPPQLGQARILRVDRRCAVGLGASHRAIQLGEELGSARMAFHIFAPEHRQGRHMIAGEHFHLVVSDDDGNVGPVLFEEVRKAPDGLLAALVARLANLGSDLVGQALAAAQFRHLVESVGVAPEKVARVFAVRRDPLYPEFRRNREHRAVRGRECESNARHATTSSRARLTGFPGVFAYPAILDR
jgi:hypothetical protein